MFGNVCLGYAFELTATQLCILYAGRLQNAGTSLEAQACKVTIERLTPIISHQYPQAPNPKLL
jgi:hypothetical protein